LLYNKDKPPFLIDGNTHTFLVWFASLQPCSPWLACAGLTAKRGEVPPRGENPVPALVRAGREHELRRGLIRREHLVLWPITLQHPFEPTQVSHPTLPCLIQQLQRGKGNVTHRLQESVRVLCASTTPVLVPLVFLEQYLVIRGAVGVASVALVATNHLGWLTQWILRLNALTVPVRRHLWPQAVHHRVRVTVHRAARNVLDAGPQPSHNGQDPTKGNAWATIHRHGTKHDKKSRQSESFPPSPPPPPPPPSSLSRQHPSQLLSLSAVLPLSEAKALASRRQTKQATHQSKAREIQFRMTPSSSPLVAVSVVTVLDKAGLSGGFCFESCPPSRCLDHSERQMGR